MTTDNNNVVDLGRKIAESGKHAPSTEQENYYQEFCDEPDTDDEPIPLRQEVQLPAFPVDALPGWVADKVAALAETTQTDPAMAGTSALSALSACTGGHAVIEVRRGWQEPLCLYCATIAGPGERKSAVQLSMSRPILDVERQLAEKGLGARCEAEARKQVAEQTAMRLRNEAARAEPGKRDEAMADAIGAAAIAESITVPAIPRILADDATPEATATLLAEQEGRLAIISAEGGIFDIIAGRYSKLPNMDLWLKGHSGDPVRIDRVGRPPEYIPRPALTVGLMIQPAVLDNIARNRDFRGRGFLARILYAFPVSKVGHRNTSPAPVGAAVDERYSTALGELVSGMSGWSGDPAVLVLTDAAVQAMQCIEAAVEPTLAGAGELAQLADWGAKYVGAVARIAGMLHLAEHGADSGPKTPVSAETIRAAYRIGEYYKYSAIKAFAEMGTDEATANAVYLVERVQQLGAEVVSEREIHRACKSRLKTKSDLLPALDRAVDHGYLIPVAASAGPTGGRPASPRYRVHPGRTKGTKATEPCT